jgi:pyruvate dehydrogenase (quinone)
VTRVAREASRKSFKIGGADVTDGAGTLVDVLEKIGVTHIFGLIGDSLNPLADAVRHSNIEWIGVRHEEGAALAVAGQAKLSGRLGVCCGTTGPGSTHLVAGL